MKYVIIANGNILDYQYTKKIIERHDFIVCADGGAKHLLKMGILPDIVVGDLDSIDDYTRSFFQKKGVPFFRFPPQKDSTDTELAIEYALTNQAKEITLLGVIGNRMDHTIANVMLLVTLANKGVKAQIINEYNEIMAVNHSIEIEGEIGSHLSIIPLSEKIEGVTLDGLEYPLYKANINIGSSLGISNRFIKNTARIFIDTGMLLLIKSKD